MTWILCVCACTRVEYGQHSPRYYFTCRGMVKRKYVRLQNGQWEQKKNIKSRSFFLSLQYLFQFFPYVFWMLWSHNFFLVWHEMCWVIWHRVLSVMSCSEGLTRQNLVLCSLQCLFLMKLEHPRGKPQIATNNSQGEHQSFCPKENASLKCGNNLRQILFVVGIWITSHYEESSTQNFTMLGIKTKL